ncbi:MAG: caspase family protein [Gemmataceae bacterium]|nr:caspase family protein [Gemmataceae bacterium]
MRLSPFGLVLAIWASSVGWPQTVLAASNDRLARFEPGLIVETGARMGACDVLTFTPDGKFLLACGDDKVVRIWKFNGKGLDPTPAQTLRWSIFREQRGSIYAMAVSPNEDGRYVAVGGAGVHVAAGSIAVIDRNTGNVVRALDPFKADDTSGIWALAFSPSGDRIAYGKANGSVGVWDWRNDKNGNGRRLGFHGGKAALNHVRLVGFTSENHLISLAASGDVLRWDTSVSGGAPKDVCTFEGGKVWRATMSKDRKWIAATQSIRSRPAQVFSIDGKVRKMVKLAGEDVPNGVALDAKGERLAVGTATAPLKSDFYKETGGKVQVFDVKGAEARPLPELSLGYVGEAVAFHPDGVHVASAGGDDHDIRLWDLHHVSKGPVSRIRSPGNCLWSVGLSKDSRYLGFRGERDPNPSTPNQRGKGAWRTFDLRERRWASLSGSFDPVKPLETLDGWSVRFDPSDSTVWYAVSPAKKSHALPLDWSFYGMPRCYTFIPRRGDKPARLAVGHFWGVTLFDLTADGPKVARLLIGHAGEVMGLGLSTDQKMLLSAGRDQTIAAWSLVDWPTHPELGARFLLRQDKIVVDDVDPGSPAWEAGLTKGDEVAVFAFHPSELYDPGKVVPANRRANYKILTADACMERLRQPQPGKEFYFQVHREGRKDLVELATHVRQRPLWRFFPTRNNEWVLWRGRDYYYDCSTNGDSYIGWQVSAEVDKTPIFYRAEQFRRFFHQPEKVKAMLAGIHTPERVTFPEMEPPEVVLEAATTEVDKQDVKLKVRVTARGSRDNQKLDKVLLWINDYQFLTWAPTNGSFEVDVDVPRGKLRQGANLLTLQGYNRAGGRGEATPVTVNYTETAPQPKLYGLMVGVGDYSKCALRQKKSKLQLGDLNADKDAEAMHKMWLAQKGKLYKDVQIELLVNQNASPVAIMQRLKALAKEVRPDDRLVLFFGSHGTSAEVLQELVKLDGAKVVDELSPLSFAVLGPTFDHCRPNKTSITSLDLYEAIARLPCHKLVMLDACHSGAIAVNPVRQLTRDGVGPIIVAACSPKESAMEFGPLDANQAYGLFTMAARRGLQEEFDDADRDKDGLISGAELEGYIRTRVPQLVDELKRNKIEGIKSSDTQTPTAFLPRMERSVSWVKK